LKTDQRSKTSLARHKKLIRKEKERQLKGNGTRCSAGKKKNWKRLDGNSGISQNNIERHGRTPNTGEQENQKTGPARASLKKKRKKRERKNDARFY